MTGLVRPRGATATATATAAAAAALLLLLSGGRCLAFSPSSPAAISAPAARGWPSPQGTSASTARPATLVSEAVDLYSCALATYQLPTQVVTSGALCGVSDLLAQRAGGAGAEEGQEEEQGGEGIPGTAAPSPPPPPPPPLDLDRTRSFVLKGLGSAVIWSLWYGAADELAAPLVRGAADLDLLSVPWGGGAAATATTTLAVRTLSCILLEQFLACPVIFALWDLPVPMLLGGTEPRDVPPRVRDRLGGLLVANAKLWTPVNAVLYNVPSEWRVLVSNGADLVWQAVVSATANADGGGGDGDGEPQPQVQPQPQARRRRRRSSAPSAVTAVR